MKKYSAMDVVADIKAVHDRWLAAELSSEDALFHIADLIQKVEPLAVAKAGAPSPSTLEPAVTLGLDARPDR